MIDDVPFAHITDADVATEVGIAENQIAVFKKVSLSFDAVVFV